MQVFSRASFGSRQGESKGSKINTFANVSNADPTTRASGSSPNRRDADFEIKKVTTSTIVGNSDDSRLRLIRVFRSKRLCFSCFGVNHVAKECKRRKFCSNYSKNHRTSLHIDREERSNAIDVVPVVQESSATVQLASKTDDHVMHSILPMKVSIGDKTVVTHAFYDNGSSASFISESLKQQLNVCDCQSFSLKLVTMQGS